MTDDMHKRAEAIVSAMTPEPWVNSSDGTIYKPIVVDGVRILPNVASDARGTAFLRNMAPHWLAVVRLLRSVASEDAVRETLCCYTQGVALLDALATYDSALKKELGP